MGFLITEPSLKLPVNSEKELEKLIEEDEGMEIVGDDTFEKGEEVLVEGEVRKIKAVVKDRNPQYSLFPFLSDPKKRYGIIEENESYKRVPYNKIKKMK